MRLGRPRHILLLVGALLLALLGFLVATGRIGRDSGAGAVGVRASYWIQRGPAADGSESYRQQLGELVGGEYETRKCEQEISACVNYLYPRRTAGRTPDDSDRRALDAFDGFVRAMAQRQQVEETRYLMAISGRKDLDDEMRSRVFDAVFGKPATASASSAAPPEAKGEQ